MRLESAWTHTYDVIIRQSRSMNDKREIGRQFELAPTAVLWRMDNLTSTDMIDDLV